MYCERVMVPRWYPLGRFNNFLRGFVHCKVVLDAIATYVKSCHQSGDQRKGDEATVWQVRSLGLTWVDVSQVW